MRTDKAPKTSGSPWREPIVWLVIVLVGASMAGSVQLLRLAYRDGPVDAVADQVQRTGRAQHTDLSPDMRAAAKGLSAIVRVDLNGEFVEVLPVSGKFDHSAPLELRVQHPVHASEDQVVTLLPYESGWRASLALTTDHDWRMQLLPTDGTWRLRGRLSQDQQAAHLAPAVISNDDQKPGSARP